MTFVYWGGSMSGKSHLMKHARVNNLEYAKWTKFVYINYKTTTHIFDYPWYDYTLDTQVYHKRKDFPDVLLTSQISNEVRRVHITAIPNSYLNSNKRRKIFEEIYFTPDELRKYSALSYKNTNTYYEIFTRGGYRENLFEEILEPIQFKDINITTDILFTHSGMKEDEGYKEYLRTCRNIIPYKSNIHNSIVEKLDGFGDFERSKYNTDVYLAYKHDTQLVWDYITKWVVDKGRQREKKLRKYNIPYEYFNLDEDRYCDVFGGEHELPLNMTASTVTEDQKERYNMLNIKLDEIIQWDSDEQEQKYNNLVEITDRYIDEHKLTDVRLL